MNALIATRMVNCPPTPHPAPPHSCCMQSIHACVSRSVSEQQIMRIMVITLRSFSDQNFRQGVGWTEWGDRGLNDLETRINGLKSSHRA